MAVARWSALLCVAVLAACSSEPDPAARGGTSSSTVSDGGTSTERECIDEDEDGYGRYCELGRDCDDDDPEVHAVCCVGTAPTATCPCEAGTRPVPCTPPVIEVEGGVLQCSEGAYYCRNERWSTCEAIGQYIFVPTGG